MRNRIFALLLAAVVLFPQPVSAAGLFQWLFGPADTPAPVATPSPTLMPTPTPAPAYEFPAPPDTRAVGEFPGDGFSSVKVLLKSLGAPYALHIAIDGVYAIDGDPQRRFERGAHLTVVEQDGSLWLNTGGFVLNMGSSFTLTRHEDPQTSPNGLTLAETGSGLLYCGDLCLTATDNGIEPILTIGLEEYLYGVVPYEMADSWPLEALKAQAVAARTYALSRREKRAGEAWHLADTTADQVFRGFDPALTNAIQAVDETAGVAGRYGNGWATAYFTASNGGQTALASQTLRGAVDDGCLEVRDDPFDLENPRSVVKTARIPAAGDQLDDQLARDLLVQLKPQVEQAGYLWEDAQLELPRILRVATVEAIDPAFAGTRMYRKLRFGLAVEASRPLPGPAASEDALSTAAPTAAPQIREQIPGLLYAELGAWSDLYDRLGIDINRLDCEITSVVPIAGDDGRIESFQLEVRRYGHGVGLSQRGAQMMASRHNWTWQQILAFYYPRMELVRFDDALPLTTLPSPPLFPDPSPQPTPRPTPAPLPTLRPGEGYARVHLDSNASTLNVRQQPGLDAAILATLVHGQRVIVTGEARDGWTPIRTAETEGYVSAEYLLPDGT